MCRRVHSPAVGTKLAAYLGDRAAVLGQVLCYQGLHTDAGTRFLLHVTILPVIEEAALRLPRASREHPCQPSETASSLESQLAFRATLTSRFTEICMIDAKNVSGFTKKRAKPLAAHSR